MLLVKDNPSKVILITQKDKNNCLLFPILSLTHPAIGAPNPNSNKYIDIID